MLVRSKLGVFVNIQYSYISIKMSQKYLHTEIEIWIILVSNLNMLVNALFDSVWVCFNLSKNIIYDLFVSYSCIDHAK